MASVWGPRKGKSKADMLKERNIFTDEEVRLLMERIAFDRIGTSIRLMLTTGLRVGEILGLEPKHIETDGSIIHVCQSAIFTNGATIIGPPKSKCSYRNVIVPVELRQSTAFLRETSEQFVWHGNLTSLCSYNDFRKQYESEILKIPGVRRLSPHSCRSTFLFNHDNHSIS